MVRILQEAKGLQDGNGTNRVTKRSAGPLFAVNPRDGGAGTAKSVNYQFPQSRGRSFVMFQPVEAWEQETTP